MISARRLAQAIGSSIHVCMQTLILLWMPRCFRKIVYPTPRMNSDIPARSRRNRVPSASSSIEMRTHVHHSHLASHSRSLRCRCKRSSIPICCKHARQPATLLPTCKPLPAGNEAESRVAQPYLGSHRAAAHVRIYVVICRDALEGGHRCMRVVLKQAG